MKGANAIIVSFLLILSSCNKKSLPEPEAENPDFFLDCNLSGTLLLREAGNNDYYMNTSYSIDANSVYLVKGDLSKSCNSGCDYGFTVEIKDFKPSVYGAPMDINKSLYPGAYSYKDIFSTSNGYTLNLEVEKPRATAQYTWIVSSNTAPDSTGSEYKFAPVLKDGNVYTVTLKTEDISGCYTEHVRVYKVGSTKGNIIATPTSTSQLSYNFTIDFPDQQGSRYLWDFGDGTKIEGKDVDHLFNPSSSYYYTSLRIITGSNDTVTLKYQIPGTMDAICTANFSSTITEPPSKAQLSRVTVVVTDPSGKVFTTRDVEQPATSFFNIDEVSDYQPNKNGESTKKLKIRLNCVLRNGTDQIELKDGKASIAVAYK